MNNQTDPSNIIVVLEWSFSPSDYFEEPISIERDDYQMTIDNGKAEAQIRPDVFENNPTMSDDLTGVLNTHFLGAQLVTHKSYQLSKASLCRLHPDGRKDITIFAEPIVAGAIVTAEFSITDKDGKVIFDSRRARIEKKKQFASLAEKYCKSDPTAASLFHSYHISVTEPNNELVHLYEIRDALSKRFTGKTTTISALNISAYQWSRLGQLSNDEPLNQGRHRGKNPGSLRDATESELTEAREIARSLVEAYILYLEKANAVI